MKNISRFLALSLITGSLLFTSGCADDKLAKGLMVIGGAGIGAYLGHTLSSRGDRAMGATIGAIAGGGMGYLLGGVIK